MNRAANKSARLDQIVQLLLAHPEGLTQAELARRLGVNRSTIMRNLADVPGYIYEDEDGTLKIDPHSDLINLRLNLHEAMAVHLAARLLATRMDRKNRHVASALRKLGQAIARCAIPMSRHVLQAADVMDASTQRDDPEYLSVLECLTEAWARGRKTRIWHQVETGETILEYLLSPYFVEPYAIGQTTHVIGKAQRLGERGWRAEQMRTFKIERIRRAEMTDEPYQIPDDFDPRLHLNNAWGIWTVEGEPVEVVLRFSQAVARRVQETRWHHSERTEPQTDGTLIWRAQIAEPKEMLPWIRGWGADCEVLEPEELRQVLEKEVKKMVRVYRLDGMKLQDNLIAHRRKRDGEEQDLIDHLEGTAKLASHFAQKIGLSDLGNIIGLVHDFGKASKEFQDYLRSATGLINPDEDDYVDVGSKKGKIDHSTAGAQLVYQKCSELGKEGKWLGQFLTLIVASHHSGLIDCLIPSGENNFGRRIAKDDSMTHLSEAKDKLPQIKNRIDTILTSDVVETFKQRLQSLEEKPNDSRKTISFKCGLLARFLLSCLLDADRLNTADFEFPENNIIRQYGNYIAWDVLIQRLEDTFNRFDREAVQMKEGSSAREVDQLRAQVAKACLNAATKPKGIYQLTVPTGGGKTLASLRFALHHARHHKMDRIFYIAPYITIIDQNADTLRKILEFDDERGYVVLEHHSNFVPENDSGHRHSLLAENWDAPIVCTTQVQFLETLFGAGTRDARRMHQLANAVIILDEVQTIPVKIVHMLNTALRFLAHSCGSTIVLCTATQPPLDRVNNPYRSLIVKPEQRIIENEAELFQRLKRVETYDMRTTGVMTNDDIIDLAKNALRSEGSVLIVVNTRAMARTLYEQIRAKNLAPTYHLSTNMCPAHRMEVLNKIKAKLAAHEPVICVSTQLIEAGVDIDFGAVIRSLAGLDSIAQSAGRCNRHGLREHPGKVWIVKPESESLGQLDDIRIGRDCAERVLDESKLSRDPVGLEAIETYYGYYYEWRRKEMEYPIGSNSSIGRDDTLFRLLSTNDLSVNAYRAKHNQEPPLLLRQSFYSAAKEFRVIESPTFGVIVPYGEEGLAIINALCSKSEIYRWAKFLRKAQMYSISLFQNQFHELLQAKAIYETESGIYYLDQQYYSEEFGWSDTPISGMDVLIV